MPSFQAILRTAALLCLLLLGFATPLFAQVYKWIDNEGKTHFTDNIESIPEEFRSQLKKHKLPEPSTVEDGKTPEVEAEKSPPDEKSAEAEEEKPAGPSPEETAAINEAIGFLSGSIPRYGQYEGYTPNLVVTRQLYGLFQGDLPAKKALTEKLDAMELPVLKETAAFLRGSLAEDEKFTINAPMMWTRTQNQLARLKAEGETMAALIKKLENALEEPAAP